MELTIAAMTAQAAEQVVDHLLAIKDISAAFCANDLVALGVLRQLSLRGVAVPDDLSLVGYDDSYFASPALARADERPTGTLHHRQGRSADRHRLRT